MTPVTYEIRPCKKEIAACQWMAVHDLETCGQTSAVTRHVLTVVRHGLANGFDQVLLGCCERPSIYRDLSFNIYSVLAKLSNTEDCVHGIIDVPHDMERS